MDRYEMSARDNLRIIFKRKSLLPIFAVLSLIFTTIFLSFFLPKYKSEVRLLVASLPQVDSSYYAPIPAFRTVDIASTVSEVIKSRDLLRDVTVNLGLDKRKDELKYSPLGWKAVKLTMDYVVNPVMSWFKRPPTASEKLELSINRLAKQIRVDSIERTDVIRVAAIDYDPVMASKIADALTKRYILFNMMQQMDEYRTKYGEKHPKITILENQLKAIREEIAKNTVGFSDAMSTGNIKVIEQASVPAWPSTPNKKIAYLVTLVLFIIFGIAGMFAMEMLDHSVKTPLEVEKYLGLHVLASIPALKTRMASDLDPNMDDSYYGAYELFAGRLQILVKERHPVCVAVTSTEKQEGKSVTAKDIAVILSKRSHIKTLLIDANTKSPSLNRLFGLPENPGLSDILDGDMGIEKAKNTINNNLDVITAGRADSRAAFKADKIRHLIDEAKKHYDLVIFDTPSMKSSAATLLVCKQADLGIMVVKESSTRREVIKDILRKTEREGITFLGAVLTNQRYFIPAFIYKHV
ncbi:MAG: Wzz/FepE/Etk N-terminal domain-containing protein [Candidatus Omnitrophica bacterium]|nr:Wzz/FepE/Etk N-terminal domain-containing protein [Candidatus Omnitrophota bacterium]MDD5311208.1 Wzz/FepE/Etk N-terminal domain-containing protein [Candidatus Omnitrophota bacterium]MDD5546125.1 Wzz/FepE/Etk N-terminal domain-containing protein [Candidatus Omnitrophota bacterium]